MIKSFKAFNAMQFTDNEISQQKDNEARFYNYTKSPFTC